MLFFSLSNIDIEFAKIGRQLEKLTQKTYSIAKIILTIDQIDIINKRKITKIVVDISSEIFVVYIAALKIEIKINLFQPTEIATLR